MIISHIHWRLKKKSCMCLLVIVTWSSTYLRPKLKGVEFKWRQKNAVSDFSFLFSLRSCGKSNNDGRRRRRNFSILHSVKSTFPAWSKDVQVSCDRSEQLQQLKFARGRTCSPQTAATRRGATQGAGRQRRNAVRGPPAALRGQLNVSDDMTLTRKNAHCSITAL